MNKFKVGETYEIIGHAGKISHSFSIGDEVELVHIASNGKDHYYRRKDDLHQFVCDEDVKVKKRCKQNNQKIVITSDGTETLARLYENGKVVKSATAKCSPEDEFNFNIGAKLAFDRLICEEKTSEEWRVVHRHARAGDYIRIKKASFSFNEIGDILKVAESHRDYISVKACDHPRGTDAYSDYLWHYLPHYYEVVEHVTAEKKEEYYNGKVVCVRRGWNKSIPLPDITIGKVYTVVDGVLTFDNGTTSFRYKSLNDLCRGMGHEFICLIEEKKGE